MFTVDDPVFEAIYKVVGHDNAILILESIVELDINDKIDFITALQTAMKFDSHQERMAEINHDQMEREMKNMARTKRDDKVSAWVKENVKPGMMIRVSNTRDGTGFRMVLDWQLNGRLECQKCYQDGDSFKPAPYITTHMPKKVVKVLVDGEWKSVVDLVKEEIK